jgi:thiol:disulfide interchange protein
MQIQRIISVAALGVLTIIAAGLVWRFSLDSQYLAENAAEAPQHIDESTNTLKQISDALVIAKRDNKRVLLQFGARGCTWCHLLDNLFEKNTRIIEELRSEYIVIMVDVSDGNNKVVDDRYGNPVRGGLPVTVFLDSDGTQLLSKNIAFADEDAFRTNICRIDPDKVLNFLKKWSPKKV